MQKFIENLPKTELHLHIEGTLEPEMMFAIAKRNNIKLPYKSANEVRKAYQFTDLQSFLDVYYQGTNVLLYEQDFYDLTLAYLKKAASQNVKHTEIFFDPQAHTERGVGFTTVINGISKAIAEGQKTLGITCKLIMCFLRDLTEKQAFETLEQALPFKEHIIAVGLDSAEASNPPEKFTNVFAAARKHGFLTVAHAGEEGPAEYIWQAIKLLKVSRIDHGNRCLEDPKLVKYLQETQIPLTMCPLSNLKLCGIKKLQDHPLKKLLDLGICVTVNSDDPAYFGGYINENFIAIQQALNLTKDDLRQLTENAANGKL